MPKYAEHTSVSIERSKMEIEATLRKYGADKFMSGWESGCDYLAFEAHGRHIRFVLPMPDRSDQEYHVSEGGRKRTKAAAAKAWEQDCKSRWRAMNLIIKAKLEGVERGIVTFEDEFLANTVLPDGEIVRDWLQPQIAEAYEMGKMPTMLLLESGE